MSEQYRSTSPIPTQYRSTSPTPILCRSCVGPTPFCSETSPTSFQRARLGPTSFRHRGSVVWPGGSRRREVVLGGYGCVPGRPEPTHRGSHSPSLLLHRHHDSRRTCPSTDRGACSTCSRREARCLSHRRRRRRRRRRRCCYRRRHTGATRRPAIVTRSPHRHRTRRCGAAERQPTAPPSP